MSTKQHCDTCDRTEPEGGIQGGRWIHITSVSSTDRIWEGSFSGEAGMASTRIAGDFCSISCLTRKMQAASPDARKQMMEVLQPEVIHR